LFLLKKYFNNFYKNKLYKNNLLNIKDTIIENKTDIVLLDENLIDNTNNFFTEVNSIKKNINIIMISNGSLQNLDTSVFKYLEIKIINKPFSLLSLKSQIDKFNNNKNSFEELNIKIVNLEKTEKTKLIYTSIIKIIKNNLNVLISGESGSGKNYIANTINNLISKDKILEFNYTDYFENNLINFLLNKKSADEILNAKGLKKNNFKCILFKDIDFIPLKTQLLLFNELKKKGVKSNHFFSKKKIIATTTKNMKNILRNNNFSNELFYELDMYNIYTLPLRERAEDIKPLIKNILFQLNNLYKYNKELSIDSYIKISEYIWPGNIKQLKNFITRIYNLANNNVIDNKIVLTELSNEFTYDEQNYIDNWKLNFRNFISKNIRGYLNNHKKIDSGLYYKILKDFEKPLLIEILKYTNYNQLLSSELLGINRNTLRKKMFDYDIQVTKKTSD
jgi:two-component system nitrogen regulation response regulator GlnG